MNKRNSKTKAAIVPVSVKRNKPRNNSAKFNRPHKEAKEDADGMISVSNSNRREPIISLPEIVQNPIQEVYRRYVCSAGVNGFITIYDLLNQFLFATSSTTAYSTVQAVRIKKIRVLSPITTQGTTTVVSLMPTGRDTTNNNFNSLNQQYTDSSTSIDVPAYLSLNPSVQTPFGSWHLNTNVDSNLLTINCPAGTTMDILYEFINRQPASMVLTPTYVVTTTGMTTAVLYCKYILGFVPVAVNSIP